MSYLLWLLPEKRYMIKLHTVVDGVVHLTDKRVFMCFLIQKSNLTKFNSNCDSGLTRFDGKVHLIVYCIEDRVRQNCQGESSIESQGSETCFKPCCIWNYSEGSLSATGLRVSPGLGQWFMSKELCVYNQSFISFSQDFKVYHAINHLTRTCCVKESLNFEE